jgi:hypothetical protein
MNKYRFLPSNIPGHWYVLETLTGTRVPGLVTMKPDAVGDPHRLCWKRELPQGGRRKPVVAALSAGTVGELSEKLDRFFQGEAP